MKILACDYDGTLNVGGVVSQENLEAIAAWRAAGNLFGMVSGRYLRYLREFMAKDQVPYDFLIGNNGAVISDENGRASECIGISLPTVEALLAKIRSYAPRHISVSFDEGSVLVTPESQVCLRDGMLIIDDNSITEVTQLHANFIEDGKALRLRDDCKAAFGDEVQCIMPGILGVEFISVRAGKPVGIRRLLELRDLHPELVLTVGDGDNDLAMLTAPDFCGYAMQSSMPVVLEQVSRRTESVAALIEEYLIILWLVISFFSCSAGSVRNDKEPIRKKETSPCEWNCIPEGTHPVKKRKASPIAQLVRALH